MDKKTRILTSSSYFKKTESGIIEGGIDKKVCMDLDLAKENIKALKELCEGKQVPILIDIRKGAKISRDAREYYIGKDVAELVTAQAMLVDSSLSRVLANFFLGLNKPPFPVKIFNNKENAVEWLKGFIRE